MRKSFCHFYTEPLKKVTKKTIIDIYYFEHEIITTTNMIHLLLG